MLPPNAPPAPPNALSTSIIPKTSAFGPTTTAPVSSISTEQGQNVLAQTVQQATRLSGTTPAPAPTTTPTQTAPAPVTAPVTAPAAPAAPATAPATSLTLINPDTEQTVTFANPDINKANIQSYMAMGYQLSEAAGNIPSWLTPTGVAAPTTNSTLLDQSTQALADAKSTMDAASAQLSSLAQNIGNDPQLQTILQGISQGWDTRIADLTNAENSRVAALTATGIRIGSQYTGGAAGMTGGIISAEEKSAINEIGDLQNQKAQALAAAQQAFESQKWTQYNDLVQNAQKAYEDQLGATQKLQDAQAAQDAAIQAKMQTAATDASIAKLYAAGTTNPADILSALQGNGDTTTSLADINTAVTALTPAGIPDLVKTLSTNGAPASVIQAVLKAPDLNSAYAAAGDYAAGGTGVVGEYNFYKAQATAAGQTPVDFNTYQTIDANRKAVTTTGVDTVSSLAQALVEGQLAPSELSKRSTGVGSYSDILAAANTYSQQTYGVPFNIAKADENYKFASNPKTQNTLNYLGSLIGSSDGNGNFTGGNLQQLEAQSQALGRTSFPSINNTAAWARLATGNSAMAAYQATVLEVSDQVANILQGGGSGSGSTDAKLAQATNLFNTGFSADQMTAIIGTLTPLLVSRGSSMIKNNPYLSDYADQFGIDQAGPGGSGNTGSQIILDEAAAQNAVTAYGTANPSAQANIKQVLGETNPTTGQPYTYSDAAQILGINVSAANSTTTPPAPVTVKQPSVDDNIMADAGIY